MFESIEQEGKNTVAEAMEKDILFVYKRVCYNY